MDSQQQCRQHLAKLLQILSEESSRSDLSQKLRSDASAREGLEVFYSIIRRGVDASGEGLVKLQLQSWSDSQIQAVVSIASAFAAATRSLSVEEVEPLLLGVVQSTLEFSLCCLDNSTYTGDDFSVQNNLVLLLEMLLADASEKLPCSLEPFSVDGILECLVTIVGDSVGAKVDKHFRRNQQGCSRQEKTADHLLMMLASEYVHPGSGMSGLTRSSFHQNVDHLVFTCQHWAVADLGCVRRLVVLCKDLARLPSDETAALNNLCRRVSFSTKIFKLLGNLLLDMPFVEYETGLLEACISYAEALPSLLKIKLEFVNNNTSSEGSLENLILLLLEEFVHLLQLLFRRSSAFQNLQACIAASILDSLAPTEWTYEKSATTVKLPLAYFPRSVLYMLKLLNELSLHTICGSDLKDSDSGGLSNFPSCSVHLQKIPLIKRHTVEELMKVIFPMSGQWLDNLIRLIFILYTEGVKSGPKVERSYLTKASCQDAENATSHEEEALFGDLFSEGSRSAGSTDDQLTGAVSSSNCNMYIQAATELLSFLNQCIFSPEWHPSVFRNAIEKLNQGHVDILLSIISGLINNSGDVVLTSSNLSQEEAKFGHVCELCFGLLHKLLTMDAFSDSLEDYLVQMIMKVENGMFAYNGWTLTLLADTLSSRMGSKGSQLRTKIYKDFISFIVEKVRIVCSGSPSLKELVATLPTILHVEILLMAFHLSSETEKKQLAVLVFASITEITSPAMDFSGEQLSCWALLVSRLILLLRHMLFHPSTCPPTLLLGLRTKLRDVLVAGPHLSDNNMTTHLVSWVSTALKSVTCSFGIEESPINMLINHLIDTVALPVSHRRNDPSVDSLCLTWTDVHEAFSQILGIWTQKKAGSAGDLIMERYIFSLCWDIPTVVQPLDQCTLWNRSEDLVLSDMGKFFQLSHAVLGNYDAVKSIECYDIVLSLLEQFQCIPLPEDPELPNWDFFRSGMWLSLVLPTFNAGVKDDHAKNGKLMKMLSSSLTRSLQAFHLAFISTFKMKNCSGCNFSPLELLVHFGFDQQIQGELIVKSGISSSMLEYVTQFLVKLDLAVEKRSPDSSSKFLWELLFHGLPLLLPSPSASAILLSSILSIRGIVCTLNGIMRSKDASGDVSLESEVVHQIVDSLLSVKFNRIFVSLQDKCDIILSSLSMDYEGTDQASLFVLKQMEGFLHGVSAGEVSDTSIFSWVVDKYVDIIDDLKRDPSKRDSLQFYLRAEISTRQVPYGLRHGDLMILIDSLDICCSESVNVKVFNFLGDVLMGNLCPDLKQRLQAKFLGMDLFDLSKWLEKRLLSCMGALDAVNSAKGSPTALRDSTMSFLLCLTSEQKELPSSELHGRIFEALLISLDAAFSLFDIQVARSYFQFVTQFVRGRSSVRLLLEKTIMLMEELAGDDRAIPGLKFIFSFLGTFLKDFGSYKNPPGESLQKSLSGGSAALGLTLLKAVGSRKTSDSLVLTSNQESASASLECDATSIDEDEDDGTSDGDVASIDKDEEEDANSERALASKVCTFTSSGSNFMEQHWYFCYTCDLTVSKGCCSVCAKVCHRGHRVVYSRSSRFFCDCGEGGVRGNNCQCLKPRKFTGSCSGGPVNRSSNLQSLLPLSFEGNQIAESDTDLDDDLNADGESSLSLPPLTRDVQDGIPEMLEELDLEGRVLHLCETLLPSVTSGRDLNISKDKKISLGQDMVMSYGIDVLQLKKAYKSGSLDLKIKADYSNSKELKAHLNNGSLVKSLLSVNARGRLAVGEGDKVAIFDVGQLIGQATVAPVTADKTNVKPLSKNVVRFEIVHLTFNVQSENYLAVAGYEDCQVLTLNSRGEVTDRLAIELALQGAYIRRVEWVPGSQVQLLVVTNKFVKIYDLSQDNFSPMHYLTLADDLIVDGTISMVSCRKMFLVVLSDHGILYRLELAREGNVGATPLKEVIKIQGKEVNSRGLSLYFSSTYKLLFLSYHDGTTLIGQLSPDATSFVELSPVYEEEQEVKLRPAGLHHWKELLPGSGLFSCISSVKSNSALAVCIGARDLNAQSIRHALGSSAPLVGITAYKPLSKEKVHCLVLHEDGSLQIYSYASTGGDAGANTASEKIKKLSTGILSNKAYAGANPEFPLDFFEKAICVTADVKMGGDTIRNGDSEGAKQSLASDDGYLESPSASGFKISVSNSNPDIVMVGFRVHVGNTSPNHIPSTLTIFQRVIKLDEGMRSWYDVPFTVAESLLSDEEFVVTVGPTFNGSLLSRIDSLEIYGRSKDEFGWKEKMDAVLDMEARVLGKSLLSGSARKHRSVQSAPLQEQVVADALKLLSKFYALCRGKQCSRVEDPNEELKKLKCKQILDKVFESDREPLLQAAACRILQSLFPKKEIYYQVKDTMRLLGVVKSAAFLSARLVGGGASGSWIIEEFTAQMHVVSKIALHRRSNLANFLEMNGSEVVDGLMQVLWGILDMEQPDAQTMNNIVISSVELIYCYAECLALHGKDSGERSVAPAVALLKQLLFSPNDAIQNASSLAISSRLLQVPFPRQTASSTEDAADTAIPSAASVEAASTNAQVMIEEDSITSSVQYCCDGCSTVPIQRRRWHCTVCPDFDLCEACYEVLSDQLPLPHSKDHPMTAIPIEVESLGANVNEMHYVDDVTETVFSGRSDVRPRNSAPSIHILEPNASGEFSSSVVDSVLISASKKEVNSLLLSELLEQLRGWMETTSGVRAIPVMQLFYRLSSAVNGPFIGSSKPESMNLEKLINWFLKEIKIDKPFIASSRSSFGEVAVLVFMFFTLMLRNWHQPGSDSSSRTSSGEAHERSMLVVSSDDHGKGDFASQLLLACNSLRQQPFINYLMDILQQLVHVFKSSTNLENSHGTGAGSGCGALLSVRRDFSAGNFSPFFSDSYVKSHHADIFTDYHRLLLENAFRLLYALIRPEKQDKTGEKEKVSRIITSKDLKLDGYQDVLCSYINNSQTSFVRRYARRLFLHLCGSKTHYYSVRDAWQFSSEVKRLYKHVNNSGGFQNPVSYERSVKIVKCLSTMAEVAAARPRNWQKYCLRHGDVLPFLLDGVFYFGEESVIQTLKLINLAFFSGNVMQSPQKVESGDSGNTPSKSTTQFVDTKKKKKGEDANDSALEKSYMDMEAAVEIFTDKGCEMLTQFIDCFLLEWNSSSVRSEARSVLYGIWHHGKQSVKETLFSLLLQRVDRLPVYGQNVVEYTELVTWLFGKACDTGSKAQTPDFVERCLTPDIIKCIFQTLHFQNELLANHPNSRIYNTLSGLVDFDGYYLESEPCVTCSSPEVPYSRMKLESLKSETKFTDRRIIVKCTGSYTIQTVTMNVHDARRSKSVKVLNLYYNNRPVTDLSELKNNWTLWKRAKSCHLAFNQTELKVEFPIPITACNFMIELDSFYENLQALSLEPLQCPRCSRPVTDKHGICSNCHENAYQCRQCRNINYENLDSFLCNECGYSKYGRFEFNFMAKPSFSFDDMENDDDMKRGLAAIESESENAHRRYQQLLGFKKPLLKIVSSIGESEMDSQQKDSVQQMMVSLPGPSCKINRKIALLGVLYGEKCKAAFDSVSKSVQTLQGLRRVLMSYLHHKNSDSTEGGSRFVVSRSPSNCYGCASTFVTQCLDMLHALCKHPAAKKQLVAAGILSELFENNIHQGPRAARVQARTVLCAFSEGDINAVSELNNLIQKKVMYCLDHHRSVDIAVATREELLLLSEVCSLSDEFWESRLRVAFQLLFASIKVGARHPAISEHVILPCLKIISLACTPPKSDAADKDQSIVKSSKEESSSGLSGGATNSSKSTVEASEKNWVDSNKMHDIQLVSYSEWEKGASYLDFVRRQYKVSQAVKVAGQKSRTQRHDYLALKYVLKWKRRAFKSKGGLATFELGSWVKELVLSACSQSIRSEMCMLISLLCGQSSSRRFRLLNLLMGLLPATLSVGECAAEYFELLFKMIDSEDARLFLTVRGCLTSICKLIAQEVENVEALERSLHIDISQGFILHKLIELLGKFLEVPNIRSRFMRDNLLSEVLEALIVIRSLIVQKTKLISDCNRLLKDLLDSLLLESSENKRQFIRACISGLQIHGEEKKGRTCLFILEQLCNLICPSKPESVYLLILNKAHTQEEFIRGSMTKNPYSSSEIGTLMRDVKNKICHELDLIGLLEDDYSMELLVAGNIISLDLSVAQVYEQVWKKSSSQSSSALSAATLLSAASTTTSRDSPPMNVTYRLQGLDGEATEPMIKELEEDREESQDPEVEFAIAGAVREYGGLEIILNIIQRLRDNFKSNHEQLVAVLNLLMHCCKIKENRRALLKLGALGLLLETARRAFSVEAMEPAEGILLIVESLTLEANESDDISITGSVLTVNSEETGTGEQAKKIVLMFLERLCHPLGKKSNKQQRNTEMVARILPYLTYGEPAAMSTLVEHFDPYLQDWKAFDSLQKQCEDDNVAQQATKQRLMVENFVRVSESLKTSYCGGRLKDMIHEKGIIGVAVGHLRESFPVGFKSSSEWASALKLPSVPLILSLLKGLSMGHLPTQKCIDEGGVLPLLHALEGVSGENEIGARAENLLDTLANKDGNGDGFLEEKVRSLRHATRDEMRRLALKKREQLLQGLGMRQEFASDGGERIVVSRPILEGLDDVEEEEEDGVACMVCREGYGLRPTDLLGVYSYSKRVNLGASTSGSTRGEYVYTTVSSFNVIHFQCHLEAKRADAALKNPKKEWEGATLRNNESLCNSLFPLRGPSVPLLQYVRFVDQYWDNLNALGRAEGTRLRLLTYDIVLMLARFATGASFSAESRGGGRESNSKFLPFMIQMARHLLDQGSSTQSRTMANAVVTYLSSSSSEARPSTPPGFQLPSPGSGSGSSSSSEETVQFMMVNSLLSESYESWAHHRRAFLQRGIYHAYMQHTHGRATAARGSQTNDEDLLSIIRSMLVYTGLIEQLQRFLKKHPPASSSASVVGVGEDGGLERWEVSMKERLVSMKEMVGFTKELLTWLDEMNSVDDLQEAFDVIGCLADVLSGGSTRCVDFVNSAINAGKG